MVWRLAVTQVVQLVEKWVDYSAASMVVMKVVCWVWQMVGQMVALLESI